METIPHSYDQYGQPKCYPEERRFCGHMYTIWFHMLKQVQKAHRTGRFTRGSPFFGVFSNCHTWKVTDDPPPPPPSLQLHAELCICPWAIIDRVPTILCNTSGGDLTVVEKLEWWAIRGFPRHLTGDFTQGKTDKRAGRRHEDQGGPL